MYVLVSLTAKLTV